MANVRYWIECTTQMDTWYDMNQQIINQQTIKLAEQAGFVLDELPDTVLQPLETFANLLRAANTQEVIALCANTIDRNLNEQKQKEAWLLIAKERVENTL